MLDGKKSKENLIFFLNFSEECDWKFATTRISLRVVSGRDLYMRLRH